MVAKMNLKYIIVSADYIFVILLLYCFIMRFYKTTFLLYT